jgi:DNA-binding HxlR family transcriptional regulator
MATTTKPAPTRSATATTHDPLGCRAHEVLARVGDKWSVYVIHVLGETDQPLRFGELRRRVEGISQRMLTVTLRSLERDGLVSRAMYPEVPPRVEYALTPLALTLRGIVGQLVVWSQAHLPEIDAARARYDGQAPGWAAVDD